MVSGVEKALKKYLNVLHWNRIRATLSDPTAGITTILTAKTISSVLLSDVEMTASSLSTNGWLMALRETASDRQSGVSPNRSAYHRLRRVWHLSALGIAQTHICSQQHHKVARLCNHLSLKMYCLFSRSAKTIFNRWTAGCFFFKFSLFLLLFFLKVLLHMTLCWLAAVERRMERVRSQWDIKHFVTWWSHPDSLLFTWCGRDFLECSSSRSSSKKGKHTTTGKDKDRTEKKKKQWKVLDPLHGITSENECVVDSERQLWRCCSPQLGVGEKKRKRKSFRTETHNGWVSAQISTHSPRKAMLRQKRGSVTQTRNTYTTVRHANKKNKKKPHSHSLVQKEVFNEGSEADWKCKSSQSERHTCKNRHRKLCFTQFPG